MIFSGIITFGGSAVQFTSVLVDTVSAMQSQPTTKSGVSRPNRSAAIRT